MHHGTAAADSLLLAKRLSDLCSAVLRWDWAPFQDRQALPDSALDSGEALCECHDLGSASSNSPTSRARNGGLLLLFRSNLSCAMRSCKGLGLFICLRWHTGLVSGADSQPAREAGTHGAPSRFNQGVLAGFEYMRHSSLLLGATTLDLFVVLLGGATALMPIFAHNILHQGPRGLGVLRAAPAAGALVVSLLMARFPLRRRAGVRMFVSVALYGVATVVFGLSRVCGFHWSAGAERGGGYDQCGYPRLAAATSTTVVDRRPVEAIRAFGSDSVAHGIDVFFAIGTSAADVQRRAIRARADV